MSNETKAQMLAANDWELFQRLIDLAVENLRDELPKPEANPRVWLLAGDMFKQYQGRPPHFSYSDAFNNCRIAPGVGRHPAPAPGLAAELEAEAAQEVA
jgi:hypothetical protein